jgi:hypothetical protein
MMVSRHRDLFRTIISTIGCTTTMSCFHGLYRPYVIDSTDPSGTSLSCYTIDHDLTGCFDPSMDFLWSSN